MLPINKYRIGMSSQITRTFTSEDVENFSQLSGDINPVHLDDEYASKTMFKARIVHGALASSLFSTLFANSLPGPGCIFMKSECEFLKPIYLNQEVVFKVEIVDININKKRLYFKTIAFNKDYIFIKGTALLYIPT